MRLSSQQVTTIRQAVKDLAGADARVSLFGSRVDDQARGGDIDLLVDIPHAVEDAAWLSARISGRISHRLGGRKVDVVISASNLARLPIHEAATRQGVEL